MSDDTRRVTLDIGDGFPVVLSIEHARAIRTALSNVGLFGTKEERHTAYVKAADVSGFAVPDGRRLEVSAEVSNDAGPGVDVDAPLDLDVIDFPASPARPALGAWNGVSLHERGTTNYDG